MAAPNTMSQLIVATLATLAAVASACSVPPAGCTAKKCAALKNVKALVQDAPNMGFYLGSWNKNLPQSSKAVKDGPAINYEVFTEVGSIIKYSKATSLSACCSECAQTTNCWVYHFFDRNSVRPGMKRPAGFVDGYQCYLLKGGSEKADNKVFGTPFAGKKDDQRTNIKSYDPSWVGGLCNGNASVVDDPHFTGALGTKFDFNGELDKSFCLTADKSLQVNVVLRGYEDVRTVGATVKANGKALRSWIKEVGLLWRSADGVQHTAHLVARNGKEQQRAEGFMSRVNVDGAHMEAPALGESLVAEGGFSLSLVAYEKHGAFDIDHFKLKIADLAEVDLRMRVAHPALQSPTDAEAHFNVQFTKLETTPSVHGVLGQTFRGTEEQMKKALKFSELAALLHSPVVADGESGKGFLEGSTGDYITTDVLSPDCKFSTYA